KHDGQIALAPGWRKTNLTWRNSMLDLLPSLTVLGEDLRPKEKKALGLSEKSLAFRQESPVHSQAKAAGVQVNDIIVGADDKALDMTMNDFLGFVRRNYLIGDTLVLNIIRDGKKIKLPMKLK